MSDKSDYVLSLTAVEVGRRMASGELSPVAVTEATLRRIREASPQLHAFITVREYEALQEARRAEEELRAGYVRGPLHGVPVALKDSVYMQGERTTLGSSIHANFHPPYSATVVKNLRDAGAVIVGKLNMHEYAWG